MITKGHEESFRSDRYDILHVVTVSWITHLLKLNKLYILKIQVLLYIHYISINLLKQIKTPTREHLLNKIDWMKNQSIWVNKIKYFKITFRNFEHTQTHTHNVYDLWLSGTRGGVGLTAKRQERSLGGWKCSISWLWSRLPNCTHLSNLLNYALKIGEFFCM